MRYLISAIVGIGVACGAAVASAAEHSTDTLDTVKSSISEKKAVLVDVREPSEWKAGHIDGAVLVPLSKLTKLGDQPQFAEQLAKDLPKDKVVYCHCRSGGRVLPASEILKKLGYDVRPLKPGYQDLLKAGFTKAADASESSK